MAIGVTGWGAIAYYVQQLETLDTRADKNALFRELYDVSVLYQTTVLTWLEEKVLQGSDARYAYAYAHNLHQNGLHETAASALFAAMAISRADAARCVDRDLPEQAIAQLEMPLKSEIFAEYNTFPAAVKADTIKTAKLLEGIYVMKQSPTSWMCDDVIPDTAGRDKSRVARGEFWDTIALMR